MALPNINPTSTKAWQKLTQHYAQMKNVSMTEMFANDKSRAEKFHIHWNDFLIDYSKNIVNQETLTLLQDLAKEVNLKSAINSYFSGENINQTEDRAVLHTALRAPHSTTVLVDGKNISPEVFEVKNKIKAFSNEVISGTRKGYTG
ncbi:MAG: glucose-6-phosphate isomerase, partial [Bacteroidota bacterium]